MRTVYVSKQSFLMKRCLRFPVFIFNFVNRFKKQKDSILSGEVKIVVVKFPRFFLLLNLRFNKRLSTEGFFPLFHSLVF